MQRQAGEPLRVLANDIETRERRAYAHMQTDAQSELVRDQFIQARSPRELRIQTQLVHPVHCRRHWSWPWRERS